MWHVPQSSAGFRLATNGTIPCKCVAKWQRRGVGGCPRLVTERTSECDPTLPTTGRRWQSGRNAKGEGVNGSRSIHALPIDSVARPLRERSRPVIIDVLDLQRMFLNELAARLDLLAHQDAEHLVYLEGVV
jgi:hypothetical protein